MSHTNRVRRDGVMHCYLKWRLCTTVGQARMRASAYVGGRHNTASSASVDSQSHGNSRKYAEREQQLDYMSLLIIWSEQ